ncbi:marine proteobacterial sortase target protein [Qipengyuania nanhaisediminis]
MAIVSLAALAVLAGSGVLSPAIATPGAAPVGLATGASPTEGRALPRTRLAEAGGLMLRRAGDETALAVPAVRLGTDIRASITGQSARVTVTQAFRNTSEEWMEATYLYPLPDDGAVDTLRMVVGDRIFEGKIKPREVAREIYEQARANGRKAGLVEQSRPNMFRNSVANVGPGETVLVQIELQAPVRQVAGDYALRLPLVVAPRYVAGSSEANGAISRTAALAGASDILAPTAEPGKAARAGGGHNPVSITIDLQPGFAAEAISSPYHAIAITGDGARRTVELAEGAVPANRDFELRWRAAGDAPALGLFRQSHEGRDYVMATIAPPAAERIGQAPAREMIFVIDNSGSMAGESMVAARRSLLYALETLRPQDRFNIIRFDDTMTELFPGPIAASADNVAAAKGFAHRLEAEGGTEMLPALYAALRGGTAGREGPVRQVIFLTDGALSNEADMMHAIEQEGGRSRVFMVGIGSAPNSYLMRRMAEAGRGTFTHIGMGEEAERTMQRLLDRLARPVATGLTARVTGSDLDLAPRQLPDLYAGEPLVLLGRTRALGGSLTVTGMIEGRRWSRTIDLAEAASSDAVARLWARRRIAEVEAGRWSGELSHDAADAAIEELGMAFHLVTSRTSLVAVDDTPARPEGARLTREELPLLLPAGWDFDHLFGAQSTRADRSPPLESQKERQQLQLPDTSTGYVLTLWLGVLLLMAGGAGLALGRVGWWRERLTALRTVPSLQWMAA